MTVAAVAFLAGAAAALAAVGWVTRNPTVLYAIYGHSWRRPLRVGITDADAWAGYRSCRTHHICRRHRLCGYLAGRDRGSRADQWAHQVDWRARPKRWPALRRRHRVLYLTVPWRPLALRLERRAIRHHRPPWNVHHLPPDELARRRRARTA